MNEIPARHQSRADKDAIVSLRGNVAAEVEPGGLTRSGWALSRTLDVYTALLTLALTQGQLQQRKDERRKGFWNKCPGKEQRSAVRLQQKQSRTSHPGPCR